MAASAGAHKAGGASGPSSGLSRQAEATYRSGGASNADIRKLNRLSAEMERYRNWTPSTGEKKKFDAARGAYLQRVKQILNP